MNRKKTKMTKKQTRGASPKYLVNVYNYETRELVLEKVSVSEAARELLPEDMRYEVFVRNLRNTFSQGARKETRNYFIRKLDEEGNVLPTYRERTLGKH